MPLPDIGFLVSEKKDNVIRVKRHRGFVGHRLIVCGNIELLFANCDSPRARMGVAWKGEGDRRLVGPGTITNGSGPRRKQSELGFRSFDQPSIVRATVSQSWAPSAATGDKGDQARRALIDHCWDFNSSPSKGRIRMS